MQVVVLETEIEKLGGIVPEGDALLGKALAEKKRFEDLMDAAEEAEIAEKLAKEEQKVEEQNQAAQALLLEEQKEQEEKKAAEQKALAEAQNEAT